MRPRRRVVDPTAALLTAYAASARINQYLVERLPRAIWRVPPPGGTGRTIAALVAHLHNCGLRYLERTDPEGVRASSIARASHRRRRRAPSAQKAGPPCASSARRSRMAAASSDSPMMRRNTWPTT